MEFHIHRDKSQETMQHDPPMLHFVASVVPQPAFPHKKKCRHTPLQMNPRQLF